MWLIDELKKATSGINDKANPFVTIHRASGTLYLMKQGEHKSNDRYLESFKADIVVIELTYGSHFPTLLY